jgi:hypothetical protein
MGSYRPLMEGTTAAPERNPDGSTAQALDIFLAWLLWLPDEADFAAAARTEIDRIDRLAGADATAAELRGLLHGLAQARGIQ